MCAGRSGRGSVARAPVASTDVTARPLVLASASPARLRLLRDAGLDPQVVVSHVDESQVSTDDPHELVQELASRKAGVVAAGLPDALVVGCDSMLLLDGRMLGKPVDAAEATERWRAMRGRTGTLLTGHCLVDAASAGPPAPSLPPTSASALPATRRSRRTSPPASRSGSPAPSPSTGGPRPSSTASTAIRAP
jgi:hypothetical protein